MYFTGPQFLAHVNQEGQGHQRRNVRWELQGNMDPQYAYYGGNAAYAAVPMDPLTLEEVETYLGAKLDAIANRDTNSQIGQGTSKWHRPWDIVPELRNWSAPEGDYGVGIEVEMGFIDTPAARQVAQHVRDWEYITLDYEGGNYPIEATFPPVPYSTFGTSRAMEYLDYLKANESLVVAHDQHSMVGTHVNVSVGQRRIPSLRVSTLYEVLGQLNSTLKQKYFGRYPYDYCFAQGENWSDATCRWVEFKLFNSQLDSARLQQYVDEAVSLVKLLMDESQPINVQTVHIALEEGYCLNAVPTTDANVSNDAEPVALAIAA